MTDPIGEGVALDAADSREAADSIAAAAPLGPLRVVDAVDPIESWPIGRLLSTAARLVEHAWQEALEQRDLTHAGLITLHLLDGGALDQTELAHRARVEAQTMSRTVDRLERSGFVARTSDPLDRRRRHIVRTEAGDRALEATRALEAEVFPAVGDPELVRYSLLEIIHAASRDRWGSA
jgi:DNA-binding MarR family transcriptional regulator